MAESKLPYAPRVNRVNTYQVTYGQCGAQEYQATNYTWSSPAGPAVKSMPNWPAKRVKRHPEIRGPTGYSR